MCISTYLHVFHNLTMNSQVYTQTGSLKHMHAHTHARAHMNTQAHTYMCTHTKMQASYTLHMYAILCQRIDDDKIWRFLFIGHDL